MGYYGGVAMHTAHSSGVAVRSADTRMETLDDIIALAEENPGPFGYWDPLKLAEKEFWGQSNEANINLLQSNRESMKQHFASAWQSTMKQWPCTDKLIH